MNDKQIVIEKMVNVYNELLTIHCSLIAINKNEQFDFCTNSQLQIITEIESKVKIISKKIYQEK